MEKRLFKFWHASCLLSGIQPNNKMLLNKRNIISGIRCQKALYLEKFYPDLKIALTDAEKKRLNDGIFVGQEARKYFSGGVLIEAKWDELDLALKQTSEFLKAGVHTLFEAAIISNNVIVRPDILRRNDSSSWNLYEVKAVTYKKKPDQREHLERLQDIAIQVHILRNTGWQVDQAFLILLNPECRYPFLDNLFIHLDVSKEIRPILDNLPKEIEKLRLSLSLGQEPVIDIGEYCLKPRECPFIHSCWKHVPHPSVFDIPNCRKTWDLYRARKFRIEDISPEDFSDVQCRMIQCTQENKRMIDKSMIREELLRWEYPLISLDFEAIDYPIPRFEGMKPYQKLPFQFSCHIQEEPKGSRSHFEYLHEDETDPRLPLTIALLSRLPGKGSVVAYNMTYEKGILEDLASYFPQFQEQLLSIVKRLVDPLPLIRKAVYDPAFLGSFSLKSVAPALLGETNGYAGMAVTEGMGAVVKYGELVKMPSDDQKSTLRNQLQQYCQKDTSLPLDLIDWLWNA